MAFGLEIYEADGTTAFGMQQTKPIFIIATFRLKPETSGTGSATTTGNIPFPKDIDDTLPVYWMGTTMGRDIDYENFGALPTSTRGITSLSFTNLGDSANYQFDEVYVSGMSFIEGCIFVYRE